MATLRVYNLDSKTTYYIRVTLCIFVSSLCLPLKKIAYIYFFSDVLITFGHVPLQLTSPCPLAVPEPCYSLSANERPNPWGGVGAVLPGDTQGTAGADSPEEPSTALVPKHALTMQGLGRRIWTNGTSSTWHTSAFQYKDFSKTAFLFSLFFDFC